MNVESLSSRTITTAVAGVVLMTVIAINTSFAQAPSAGDILSDENAVAIKQLDFGTRMLWALGSIIPGVAQYDIPIRLYEPTNPDRLDRYVNRYPDHVRWFVVYKEFRSPSESTYLATPIIRERDSSPGKQLLEIQEYLHSSSPNISDTWIGASMPIDELNPVKDQPVFRADLRSFDWSVP